MAATAISSVLVLICSVVVTVCGVNIPEAATHVNKFLIFFERFFRKPLKRKDSEKINVFNGFMASIHCSALEIEGLVTKM